MKKNYFTWFHLVNSLKPEVRNTRIESVFSQEKEELILLIRNEVSQIQKSLRISINYQLPYMFIITRLSHYIKVLQREQIGSWKERGDLERELNQWLSQYVANMENPAPDVRSRRPLREAQIKVEDVEGQPGWYRCSLKVRPHFKYMGADFTLSLVGKLDKE